MSLESVADDIREQARAEAEEIRDAADARAEEILAEAEADAEALVEKRREQAEREADQLREQAISSANLEAKQLRLRARRDALDDVREAVEKRIAAIEGDERTDLTATLLEAALAEFDADEPLVVRGRQADDAMLESLADEDRLEVGEPVECLGGVIVEGTRTKLRVDNTFDSILDDVWDDQLRSISELLFEE
ncbi:MAG: V-type ATP synthase subunit E [Halobacteriota archaeon]